MKSIFKQRFAAVCLTVLLCLAVGCGNQPAADVESGQDAESGQNAETGQDAKQEVLKETEFEQQIRSRLEEAWYDWKPGYEDWVKWSDSLYAPDAVIVAIGADAQPFREYQESMAGQRSAYDMDMGIIDTCLVDGDTAAITYEMSITPKGGDESQSMVFTVSELNTFAMVDGFDKPMVTRLVLASGDFSSGGVTHSVLDGKPADAPDILTPVEADKSMESAIRQKLETAWETWSPEYDEWLAWAENLFDKSATIYTVESGERTCLGYKKSMKYQRKGQTVKLGKMEDCLIEDHVAAVTYQMETDGSIALRTAILTFARDDKTGDVSVVTARMTTGNSTAGTIESK